MVGRLSILSIVAFASAVSVFSPLGACAQDSVFPVFPFSSAAAAPSSRRGPDDGTLKMVSHIAAGTTPDRSVVDKPAAALPPCTSIKPPPASLTTASKYDQTDASRSVIDVSARAAREAELEPVRRAVKELGLIGLTRVSDRALDRHYAACSAATLRNWAQAGSLSDMRSEDAYLSRDRFVVDIAMVLASLKERGEDLSDDPAVQAWLQSLTVTTIRFYQWQAGPNSKRNNHRYWAGLAVGTIGYYLDDRTATDWGKVSFSIGVCQVDTDGFLPLELARGSKAMNYHLYALRPLLAFADVAERHGDDVRSTCDRGLERLSARSRQAMQTSDAFIRKTGIAQEPPSNESAFPQPLRLSSLVGFGNRSF